MNRAANYYIMFVCDEIDVGVENGFVSVELSSSSYFSSLGLYVYPSLSSSSDSCCHYLSECLLEMAYLYGLIEAYS